jgi:endonuclease YncB( thermonuclease family)
MPSYSSLLWFMAQPSQAASITGAVEHYFDGDSLIISNQSIRLVDIDAPEGAQTCLNTQNESYRCGNRASNHLKALVSNQAANQQVRCEGDTIDQYQRLLATCYVGQLNLNRQMVLDGWAVVYRTSKVYAAEQQQARAASRGVWQGAFTEPSEFRRAPTNEQRNQEQSDVASDDPNNECQIKGNINTKGEKIYHLPQSDAYTNTNINTRNGEQWFCNEAEAIAAGWRAPYR